MSTPTIDVQSRLSRLENHQELRLDNQCSARRAVSRNSIPATNFPLYFKDKIKTFGQNRNENCFNGSVLVWFLVFSLSEDAAAASCAASAVSRWPSMHQRWKGGSCTAVSHFGPFLSPTPSPSLPPPSLPQSVLLSFPAKSFRLWHSDEYLGRDIMDGANERTVVADP